MSALRRIVEHPVANLFVALILVVTSLAEGGEEFFDALVRFDAGVHHGVLLFGLFSLLKTLPELFEAADRAREARERSNPGG